MSRSALPGLVDPSDEQWLALAANHAQAQIFHDPGWMKLLADCYGYRPFIVTARSADNQVCAGLPMMEVNSPLTGRRWVAMPFSDHCAPLSHHREAINWLTHRLVVLMREHQIPDIHIHFPLMERSGIYTHSSDVLHLLPLGPDSAKVHKKFHSMHRRNIKTAEKKGVRIEWGHSMEHIRAFYTLHLETRQRQGTPIQPWRFFEMLSAFMAKGSGFILLAYKDEECIAGAVFLHWHKTLTYKYGASTRAGMEFRPNNLIFWTAIQWGCENGFTTFDMGKTDATNEGLRDFKSKWGSEEIPLFYSVISRTPPESNTSKLMPIVQNIIQRSPAWVCRVMGEVLYRHVA